jgi:hypothetical protein
MLKFWRGADFESEVVQKKIERATKGPTWDGMFRLRNFPTWNCGFSGGREPDVEMRWFPEEEKIRISGFYMLSSFKIL